MLMNELERNFSKLLVPAEFETPTDVFARRANQGFTEWAEGQGEWVATPDRTLTTEGKISFMYAFFSPDPSADVATYQRGAVKDIMGNTQVGDFADQMYTVEEFQQTITDYQIELSERRSLIEYKTEG